MEIIQPQPSDLIEIVYLQRVCFSAMKSKGWLSCDLYREINTEELSNIFILKQDSLTLGMMKIHKSGLELNGKVEWNSSSANPLSIDSLIIHPNWWDKKIGDNLLKFAEDYAKKYKFTSIRLNTFAENLDAISLFKQLSFEQTGEFHSRFQKIPFYCYEKIL